MNLARNPLGRGGTKAIRVGLAFVLTAGSILMQSACSGQGQPEVPKASSKPPQIDQIHPSGTSVGEGFSVQASGDSAMAVTGKGFVRGARIRLDGKPTVTAYGSEGALSGLVPASLYAQPGTIQVTVENPDGLVSSASSFEVRVKSGPAPTLTRLYPSSTEAGQAINKQPDGTSALGLEGTNFLQGAKVYFGEEALFTAYGSPTSLSALLKPEHLRTARSVKVTVKNPDGKVSNVMEFVIQPPGKGDAPK